jgi:hypothetical protein
MRQVAILAMLVSGVLSAQSDPFTGTWKLNIAKSKYSSGQAPQSAIRTIEAQSDGLKASNETIAADGSLRSYSFTAKFDGKDNPISGTGAPGGADTISLKRISADTNESTTKKAGKVVSVSRSTISKDGKVMTQTSKGNANGESTSTVLVWDRQ